MTGLRYDSRSSYAQICAAFMHCDVVPIVDVTGMPQSASEQQMCFDERN